MSRLKAMVSSALEDRSPRFMLATIALGVVVSLLAGFAIGYKVDDSNGGGSGAKKTAAKPNKGKGGKAAPKLKEAPLLVGGVYSLNARKIVVLNANAKPRPVGVGRKTRIFAVTTAKSSDIKVGSRVLFQPDKTSKTTADEVIVLPTTAKFGLEVGAVTPGTSMTLKTLGGNEVVKTTGVVVRKTETGKRSSITKGDKVIVRYFVVRGKRNQATDVVLLPKDTKFQ